MIVEKLIESGAVKFGKFVLSSGKESHVYIDIKHAITDPKILEIIAEGMAKKIKDIDFSKIACIELGGVPIAVALSLKTKKGLVIFRKEKKDYGVEGDRIGEIRRGEKVIIVEDVITTGRSVKSVIERVLRAGGVIAGILAVVDREESDLEIISLLKLSDILRVYNR